ncbi:FYN-binding protein 1-like [Spea bombifrons]|uniref:FYN-binding protein 1-like n=1 Tax=Spea bombifrons TaxID=233779 RepID=UPI00234ACBDE|nr:FYN-binding protein 1-like [Spea bombifrons]
MGAKCAKIGKRELALRKKFQITGSENAVYKMSVKEDCKGGKDMLTLRKGELVEIINTTDCPPGKWLARNDNGNYGFIPVSVIDAYQDLLILGRPYLRQNFIQSDVYIEVESGKTASDDSLTTTSNYSEDLDNVYDDAGSNHSTVSNSSGRLPKILTNFLKKDAKKRNDSG